jgi:hypothetical protein
VGRRIALFLAAGLAIGSVSFLAGTGVISDVVEGFQADRQLKISGTAQVGHKVKAEVDTSLANIEFTYQWLRDGQEIEGANKASYWLTKADEDSKVKVMITGLGDSTQSHTSGAIRVKTDSTGDKLTKPFKVKDIWVVSKTHRVSKKYAKQGPEVFGLTADAGKAYRKMVSAAKAAGYSVKATTVTATGTCRAKFGNAMLPNLAQTKGRQHLLEPVNIA